jgi:hypothetical protein
MYFLKRPREASCVSVIVIQGEVILGYGTLNVDRYLTLINPLVSIGNNVIGEDISNLDVLDNIK